MTGVVDLYFIALSALEQFIMLRQLYIEVRCRSDPGIRPVYQLLKLPKTKIVILEY